MKNKGNLILMSLKEVKIGFKKGRLTIIEDLETIHFPEHLTIDRIDVLGDYSPDNCQWITAKENIEKEYGIDRSRRMLHEGG